MKPLLFILFHSFVSLSCLSSPILDCEILEKQIDYVPEDVPVISKIEELYSFSRGAKTIVDVKDVSRGGIFKYFKEGKVDSGITFPAVGGGYWIRQFKGNIIYAKWYGVDGSGKSNDLNKLLIIVAKLNTMGGGTLFLPKRVMINNNLLNRFTGILICKSPINIRPELDRSTIIFNNHTVPLLLFLNTDGPSIKDIDFVYTGNQINTVKGGAGAAFLSFIGVNDYGTFNNEFLSSVIVSFATDRYRIQNLTLKSQTSDNLHSMAYFINLHGRSGISDYCYNGIVENIVMQDYQTGIFLEGQKGLKINNIKSNNRGYSPSISPGHVIYTQKAGNSNLTRLMYNENIIIKNITEGPDFHSLDIGTLSIKYTNNSKISNIFSEYPSGLIQSIESSANLSFDSLYWKGNNTLEPSNPIINLPNNSVKKSITFKNVILDSGDQVMTAIEYTGIAANQTENVFENLIIRCGVYSLSKPTSQRFIISSRANGSVFKNITYIPTNVLPNGATQAILFYGSPGSLNNTFQGKVSGKFAKSSLIKLKGTIGRSNVVLEPTDTVPTIKGFFKKTHL
jgi:hypothetical protein